MINAIIISGLEAWASGDLQEFGKLISASGLSSIQNYECGIKQITFGFICCPSPNPSTSSLQRAVCVCIYMYIYIYKLCRNFIPCSGTVKIMLGLSVYAGIAFIWFPEVNQKGRSTSYTTWKIKNQLLGSCFNTLTRVVSELGFLSYLFIFKYL